MISASTRVHVTWTDPQGLKYMVKPDTTRNNLGEIVFHPLWSYEARDSRPISYELAVSLRERVWNEARIKLHFTLSAGDSQFIEDTFLPAEPPTKDERVPMMYRGIVAVPGIHVTHGRCWFVRFLGTAIESIRGNSPEEVIDKVYARPDLLPFAEKAPQESAPEVKEQRPVAPRLLPSDR